MDKTNEYNIRDIEENKFISSFAYFGFAFIMPLWGASDSPFARFHANQGIVLTINELVFCILIFACHMMTPISAIFSILRTIFWLALVVMIIFCASFGVVNTLKGRAKELPLIGSIWVIHR